MQFRLRRLAAIAATAGIGAALLGASPASAATASETVTAGSLSFISGSPANVAFPATALTGLDILRTQSQAFDVSDATGSGSGWSITATSTLFTAGAKTLTGTASVVGAPTVACDSGSTCTLPTNTVGYPFEMPTGVTAPPAGKLYNAAANTGMGNITVTPTWTLLVPGKSATGSYTSTWTFTLVSGP